MHVHSPKNFQLHEDAFLIYLASHADAEYSSPAMKETQIPKALQIGALEVLEHH